MNKFSMQRIAQVEGNFISKIVFFVEQEILKGCYIMDELTIPTRRRKLYIQKDVYDILQKENTKNEKLKTYNGMKVIVVSKNFFEKGIDFKISYELDY